VARASGRVGDGKTLTVKNKGTHHAASLRRSLVFYARVSDERRHVVPRPCRVSAHGLDLARIAEPEWRRG